MRHTGVETETKIKRTIAAKQKKNYIISEMGSRSVIIVILGRDRKRPSALGRFEWLETG